jgi:hypothetical protein
MRRPRQHAPCSTDAVIGVHVDAFGSLGPVGHRFGHKDAGKVQVPGGAELRATFSGQKWPVGVAGRPAALPRVMLRRVQLAACRRPC